jgi:hypothetical protein
MAGVGGILFEKSSEFVTSIMTFPAKFFSPAIVIALGVPSHQVAITTIPQMRLRLQSSLQ